MKKTNKKSQIQKTVQWLPQGKGGGKEDKGKGVKCMVTEGDLTMGGEHPIHR